jgi:hypothetical protein
VSFLIGLDEMIVKKLSRLIWFMFFLMIDIFAASAADYQLITLDPGQTVDVYFEINLSGSLTLRVETVSGPGCADFWWIKWPLGNIKSLGKICGTRRIEIPGLSDFAISGKLRASGVARPTKIVAASNEHVANSVTLRW